MSFMRFHAGGGCDCKDSYTATINGVTSAILRKEFCRGNGGRKKQHVRCNWELILVKDGEIIEKQSGEQTPELIRLTISEWKEKLK